MTSPDGGTIRYTTNGAEPTSYSSIYTGSFDLNPGTHTVKAKVFLSGASPSDTATRTYAVYSLDAGKVETPRFIPAGGNHTISVTVRLETDTQGADIYYTLAKNIQPPDPTTGDDLYDPDNPIVLNHDPAFPIFFLRAKAFKTGQIPSDVAPMVTRVFTAVNTVETPTVSLPGGVYTEPVDVDLAVIVNPPFKIQQLFYTTDGTDPFVPYNTAGPSPVTLNLDEATQVKAIGSQLGWFHSEILDESYEFVCDTPQITPGGVFTETAQVTMLTTTPDAVIYYTTDGSEPDDTSDEYVAPFNLGVGTTIVRAKCYRGEFDPSATVLENYVVNPAAVAPVIIQHPSNVTVVTGTTVTFTVQATGYPTPTIQWQYGIFGIAGENEPELVLPSVNDGYVGQYPCRCDQRGR